MRSARTHPKSRKGCRSCKSRKVKCDEARPVCGNCARRLPGLLHCNYGETAHLYQSILPPHEGRNIVEPNETRRPGTLAKPSFQQRSRDVQLFHQWMTSTSQSLVLPTDTTIREIWVDYVPKWACESEFLLDNVLATSALHLWWLDPEKNPSMKPVALELMADAAAKQRDALSHIDESTAQPLLAASILTVYQSYATARFRLESEPYSLPIDALKLHRGIRATWEAALPFMSSENILRRIFQPKKVPYERGMDLQHIRILKPVIWQDAENVLAAIESKNMGSETKGHLRAVISYLMAIEFSLFMQEPIDLTRRRVSAMPSFTPAGFFDVLEQQNSLAMGILARYYVQMKIANAEGRQWWLQGLPDRAIAGIEALMPADAQWLMEFPINRLYRHHRSRSP